MAGLKRFVNLVVLSYSVRELLVFAAPPQRRPILPPNSSSGGDSWERSAHTKKSAATSYPWNRNKKKRQQPAASSELESIRRPPALLSVRPSACPVATIDQPNLHSFTLPGSKIFFTDSAGRLFYYDSQRRCIVTTPNLHAPKSYPFAISVPGSADDDDNGEQDHGLYIMEKILSPAKEDQFEALFCRERQRKGSGHGKVWYRETLPPPPYVHEPAYKHASLRCYAVVGKAICISVSGVGTYCFDTVNKTWSWAGDWLMPFMGKAE